MNWHQESEETKEQPKEINAQKEGQQASERKKATNPPVLQKKNPSSTSTKEVPKNGKAAHEMQQKSVESEKSPVKDDVTGQSDKKAEKKKTPEKNSPEKGSPEKGSPEKKNREQRLTGNLIRRNEPVDSMPKGSMLFPPSLEESEVPRIPEAEGQCRLSTELHVNSYARNHSAGAFSGMLDFHNPVNVICFIVTIIGLVYTIINWDRATYAVASGTITLLGHGMAIAGLILTAYLCYHFYRLYRHRRW